MKHRGSWISHACARSLMFSIGGSESPLSLVAWVMHEPSESTCSIAYNRLYHHDGQSGRLKRALLGPCHSKLSEEYHQNELAIVE
eukprot:scaffold2769_cov89-Skeletonema_marinoi.AAC.5